MKKNTGYSFYGMEEYTYFSLRNYDILHERLIESWGLTLYHITISRTSVVGNDLPVEPDGMYDMKVTGDIVIDHPELLNNAKKLYVHPSCQISRTLISTKYSKCLNPWMADAVVIPDTDMDTIKSCSYCKKLAVFINEDKKCIIQLNIFDDLSKSIIESFELDTTLMTAMQGEYKGYLDDIIVDYPTIKLTAGDILNSQLMYYGNVLSVSNNSSYIIDAVTNGFPKDKTVFESTVLSSLSGEENSITFDSLISIGEMLSSNDSDSVGAAIKAISVMDYINYPNSVKYIFSKAEHNLWHNHAIKTTTAKFMVKQLNLSRRSYYMNYDGEISKDDYEMFKMLKQHYECKNGEDVGKKLMDLPFMTISDGMLVPIIRKSAHSIAV